MEPDLVATASADPDVVVYPDGRQALTENAALKQSSLWNADLGSVPVAGRTWTTYNYAALWITMAHTVTTYLLASGLIVLGMNWIQALLTIALGNIIVLIPMLLNSHAGTRYGIPFPVFARASFGVHGANIATVMRGLVACGWFGIDSWIGGQAIFAVGTTLLGHAWSSAATLAGQPWTLWISYAIFLVLEIVIIWFGMGALRRIVNFAAPTVFAVVIFLLVWMLSRAHGVGPIISAPSKLGWGLHFWIVFFPALMGMIAFWAPLSLNMPDFTRFSSGQRAQSVGQSVGLPATMTVFSLFAVFISSGSAVVFHQVIWNPIDLMQRYSIAGITIVGILLLALSALATNLAANVISPSYDFSNLWPKKITFRVGGLIAVAISILIQPWHLLASANFYIFTWLDFYGGALAAIAGVMIADYWIMRRTRLLLGDLYREHGAYRYSAGYNWRAIVAAAGAILLSLGGAYSAPAGSGPFPPGGLVPALKSLYDYDWAVGLIAAIVIYAVLSMPTQRRRYRRLAGVGDVRNPV